jgi:superfamily II DNA or RNA helicase
MLKKLLINLLKDGYSIEKIIDFGPNLKEEILNEYKKLKRKKLREYQNEVITDMDKSYKTKKNYSLFWCCGLGKSIPGLEYFIKHNLKTLCICVPSIILLEQFEEYLDTYMPLVRIFKLCCEKDKEDIVTKGNDVKDLKKYLFSNLEYKIVLTTYHSTKKLVEICLDRKFDKKSKPINFINEENNYKFIFDLVIFDEAHHLVNKKAKLFTYSLLIPSKKNLFQTATPFIGETKSKYCLETSAPFQGTFNKKSLYFGIDNGYISDYRLIILKYNLELINSEYDEFQHKHLLISCLMALKSIYNNLNTKILIYCNTVKNSKIIKDYLNQLILKYNGKISEINPRGLSYNIFNDEINGKDHNRKM